MAPKKLYTPGQMGLAIEAVCRGESYSAAAKKYGVPRMTLRNKVTGKSPVCCPMGPSTTLSDKEESVLVQWLFAMEERHCPVGKEQLLDSVQFIIKSDKRENPFKNDRPGRKWFNLFLKRHPEISERVSQNLTTSREAVNEGNIIQWFSEVQMYIENNNLKEAIRDPKRVFNSDESAFFLNPKPGRVLVKRGDKNIYSLSGNEKENYTVLLTANAAGQLPPPMVVFSYERIPRNIADSIPRSWGIGRSENGWMCGSTFFEYITNIFYPWLIETKIQLPVIFFLDGHASHLTKHLSDFCSAKQIEIIILYPNSTHLLQPMDVAVFRPLKLFWREQTRDWKTKNLGQQIKKENFGPLLKCALENITTDCIKNGFRAAGLYPFGPELIDFTKLNVRNRSTMTKCSMDLNRNSSFLSQLEREISSIFTKSVLDTFNKCFYLAKSDLTTELPNEYLPLYAIWAKYKHLCEVTGAEDIDENTGTHKTADNLQRESQKAPLKNSSSASLITASTDEAPLKSNPNLPSTSSGFVELIDENTGTYEAADNLQFETQKTPLKNTSSASLTASTDKAPLQNNPNLPSTSSGFVEYMLEKGVVVPSPFKRVLFWPDETSKKKRRIPKEKIPSAITSQAWREYYEKKESVKKAKEEAKEQRKQIRLEKKQLKNKRENKASGCKSYRKKYRKRSSTSSEDEESEINYVETGESDLEIQSDDEDMPLMDIKRQNTIPNSILNSENLEPTEKMTANEGYTENGSLLTLPSDLAPDNSAVSTDFADIAQEELQTIKPFSSYEESANSVVSCSASFNKEGLTIDDYVVVTWNERAYPGQIVSESQEGILVSCMKKTKGFWHWPVIKDIQLYHWDKVVRKIEIPKFIKKGFFAIPEMNNL